VSRDSTGAVVTLAALDLRRDPDHRSELRSQLLLGERVGILAGSDSKGWLRIRSLEDEYEGWVRAWGLRRMGRPGLASWVRKATGRLRGLFAPAFAEPAGRDLVLPLFWGALFGIGVRRGHWRRIELPSGSHAWVRADQIRDRREAPPTLSARVRSLLGVPYLWGGRTSAGLDCSGLTQLVLREQGIDLPRDAADQFEATAALGKAESPRKGDLVFFARPRERPSHVGIYLDRGTFVHCRGDVHVGSLKSGNPLSENELIPQFRGIRRALGPPETGPLRARRGGESA
jgi:hypothetical protein